VVQPRHRNNPHPLTRWTWRLAAPARHGRVFQQSFAAHWTTLQHAPPRYQTPYYDGLVAKRRACGQPDTMGYGEYRGLQGGQGTPVVAMSCPSSWC
jgi:hypothetical protein